MHICIYVSMYTYIFLETYARIPCMYVYVSKYACMFDKPDGMSFA